MADIGSGQAPPAQILTSELYPIIQNPLEVAPEETASIADSASEDDERQIYRVWEKEELRRDCFLDPDMDEGGFFERYYAPDDMDGFEFATYWIDYWGIPDSRLLRHESSFDEDIDITKRQALYDSCTAKELQKFVRDRRLLDPFPEGLTLKYCYLKQLLAADGATEFLFMDLPAEVRLMMYKEMLALRFDEDLELYAEPVILQTCRQINTEATHVLYGQQITCTFFMEGDRDSFHGMFKIHNHTVCVHHSMCARVPHGIDYYPEFLRRITHLRVRIHFDASTEERLIDNAKSTMNHALFTLSSFLNEGHSLKHLTFNIHFSSLVETPDIRKILFPLRRIRNVPVVEIRDLKIGQTDAPEAISRKLISDIQSYEPVYNTCRMFKLLSDEVSANMNLISAMFADDEFLELEWLLDETPLFNIWGAVELASYGAFVSSAAEEHFQGHLAEMQHLLESIDFRCVKQRLRSLEECRQSRRRYNKESDDGKLDEASLLLHSEQHNPTLANSLKDAEWSDDDKS